MRKTLSLFAVLFAAHFGCAAAQASEAAAPAAKEAQAAPAKPIRVLAFSKTNGYRHADQIALSHAMLKDFAKAGDIVLDARSGEDPAAFTDDVLKNVDVVCFVHTTEVPGKPVLDKEERAAFERFIKRGGGWAGIHAACAVGYDWPFFTEMLGAHFKTHPAQQTAELRVVDAKNPSTAHLDPSFKHREEWYDFDANVALKPEYHLLLKVDEKTYKPKSRMGDTHPIAWTHAYQDGRAWYTALGHTTPQYSQEWFRKHVLGGIRWAAGADKNPR